MYVEAARLFNFTYVKLHPLDISDIEILEDVFPFVNTDDVVHNLELEKNDYNIAASNKLNADAGHDLWAFWHDNRLKLPFWYNVAKDLALVQPSSAFMERMFSILRACLDERQETCYSNRIRASALLKYNRGRKKKYIYFVRDALPCTAVLYTLVIWRDVGRIFLAGVRPDSPSRRRIPSCYRPGPGRGVVVELGQRGAH